MQANMICRTSYFSTVRNWDPILVQPFLIDVNVIMDVRNKMVSMHPTGKPRQQFHILYKQSHAVSTVACSIYVYDHDIWNNSSSHVPEIDAEDVEAESTRYYDGSAAHIQSSMYCLHASQ